MIKKLIALVLVFCMAFFPVSLFAEGVVEETQELSATVASGSIKTVFVRIEGEDSTVMDRTQVTLSSNTTDNKITVQGALEKVLTEKGYDIANKENLDIDFTYGFAYLKGILGMNSDAVHAWMYTVNDISIPLGIDSIMLNDGDEITFYFMEWANENFKYAYFDEKSVEANKSELFSLSLKGLKDGTDVEAVSDAIILISDNFGKVAYKETQFKTDATGKAFVTINEAGEYVLSAVKLDDKGAHAISRPFAKVVVKESGVGEVLDKSMLREEILKASKLSAIDYTETTFLNMLEALANARSVERNVSATQAQIDEALNKLVESIKNLKQQTGTPEDGLTVSLTELVNSITDSYMKKSNYLGDFLTDWQAFGLKVNANEINNPNTFASNSVLKAYDDAKYTVTDLARSAIAVTAVGKNAKRVSNGEGQFINLIELISNYEKNSLGTVNAYTYSLLAYDSANYEVKEDAKFSRNKIIEEILNAQNPNGGWALIKGQSSKADITAMALTALAPYKNSEEVKSAIDRGIVWLSQNQKTSGGFEDNSEYTSQTIVALVSLGIDPLSDTRFVKGSDNLLTNLLKYKTEDNQVKHVYKGNVDYVATEQAYYALGAYLRFAKNNNEAVNIYKFYNDNTNVAVSVNVRASYEKTPIINYANVSLEENEGNLTAFSAVKKAFENLNVSFYEDSQKFASVLGFKTNDYSLTVNEFMTNSLLGEYLLSPDDNVVLQFGKKGTYYLGEEDLDISFSGKISNPTIIIDSNKSLPNVKASYLGVQTEIKKDTVINAVGSYLGEFALAEKKQKSYDLNTVTEYDLVMSGQDKGLTFSKPIKMSIPNTRGTKIGFYSNGIINEIKTSLSQNSFESAEASLQGEKFCAYYKNGNELTIYTKKPATFVSYYETTKDTLFLTVADYNSASGSIIFAQKEIPFAEGLTAVDLLNMTGIEVEVTEDGYVKSIDGLKEFDNGPLSGWMFSVNDTFYDESGKNVTLSPHDAVRWLYTRDGGQDIKGERTAKNADEYKNYKGNLTIKYLLKKKDDKKEEEPRTSLKEVDKVVGKILKNYEEKEEISDWEQLAIVLNEEEDVKAFKETKEEEILKRVLKDFRLPTDLARTIILLKASGNDIKNYKDVNLFEKLYTFEKVGKQGTNGFIFTLIALDSEKEQVENAEFTKEKLIKEILDYQNENGGIPLAKESNSNTDMTAMALQALSFYYNKEENGLEKLEEKEKLVKSMDKAITYIWNKQKEDGTFNDVEGDSSETISQVIIMLTALGINPDHEAFTVNDKTLLTLLMEYKLNDGNFSHKKDNEADDIATEHAVLALTSYKRFFEKKKHIYDFSKEDEKNEQKDDKKIDEKN